MEFGFRRGFARFRLLELDFRKVFNGANQFQRKAPPPVGIRFSMRFRKVSYNDLVGYYRYEICKPRTIKRPVESVGHLFGIDVLR